LTLVRVARQPTGYRGETGREERACKLPLLTQAASLGEAD
jgi:hypothetical protein